MLSTNSTSSVQKRRQQHRRQQTLAVPLLAPHHPAHAHNRRNQPARNAHRRGLSLDHSLSVLNSPIGMHSLQQQDHQDQDHDQDQRPGSSPVRIQLDTNTGHSTDHSQHFQQETQQHSLAQPGFQAQDFQSHLRQQLQGHGQAHVATQTPIQQQALQQLQHHVEWYNKNFGSPAEPSMPFDFAASPTAMTALADPARAMAAQIMQHGIAADPTSPIAHTQPRTVPNTPRHLTQAWPSPPPTHAKQGRRQSFQVDVAPMPTTIAASHGPQMAASSPLPYIEPVGSFTQDSFAISGDHGYSSSAYSSSVVDPISPGRSINANALPTLFEEPIASMNMHGGGMGGDTILLQGAAGAADDFNNPNFLVGDGEMGLSPKDGLLDSLGPNVNASIIDTGVPTDEIDRYISEQDSVTKLFYCLWIDDGVQCDKWHKRKENARSHVQGHLGDRQFLCNDCGKTFVRQHDMKRHAAIHNPERPHRCPCGSRFARHDALTRHRQRGMCKGALPGFERSEEDKPKRGRPKKKDRPSQEVRSSKAQRARQMDRENAIEADSAIMHYHSSSSVASERSLPMTPPDTSDFDADAFINMAGGNDIQFNTAPTAWNDTPPTSPAALNSSPIKNGDACDFGLPAQVVSPAMLSQYSNPSSPVGGASSQLPTMMYSHPSPAESQGGASASFHGASSPLDEYSHGMAHDDDFNFGAINSQPGAVAGHAASDFFSDAFSPSESSGGSEDLHGHHHSDLPFADDDNENTRTHDLYMRPRTNKADDDFMTDFILRDRLFDERERDMTLYSALDQFISTH